MRTVFVFGLLMLLAACSADPKTYGITGPGTQPTPTTADINTPDTAPTPGVSTAGSNYGPSVRPSTGSSGFWGYN